MCELYQKRHNPQFNEKRRSRSLQKVGVQYVRLEELGGFRHTTKDSKNFGWHKLSFRGFADYMGTSEFTEGLRRFRASSMLSMSCRRRPKCYSNDWQKTVGMSTVVDYKKLATSWRRVNPHNILEFLISKLLRKKTKCREFHKRFTPAVSSFLVNNHNLAVSFQKSLIELRGFFFALNFVEIKIDDDIKIW